MLLIGFSLVWSLSFKADINLMSKGAFLGAEQMSAESLNLTLSRQPARQHTSMNLQGITLGKICSSTPHESLACNMSICLPICLLSLLHVDVWVLWWEQPIPPSQGWFLQLPPTTLWAEGPFSSPPPHAPRWGWLPPHGWAIVMGQNWGGKGLRRESQPWWKITPLFGGCVRGGIHSEEFHAWKVRQVSWKGYYLEQTNPSAGWAFFCIPQTKSQHNQRAVRSFFLPFFFAASVPFPFISAAHRNYPASLSSAEYTSNRRWSTGSLHRRSQAVRGRASCML